MDSPQNVWRTGWRRRAWHIPAWRRLAVRGHHRRAEQYAPRRREARARVASEGFGWWALLAVRRGVLPVLLRAAWPSLSSDDQHAGPVVEVRQSTHGREVVNFGLRRRACESDIPATINPYLLELLQRCAAIGESDPGFSRTGQDFMSRPTCRDSWSFRFWKRIRELRQALVRVTRAIEWAQSRRCKSLFQIRLRREQAEPQCVASPLAKKIAETARWVSKVRT